MTVQLAPIRPHDLRAGDVLIAAHGGRWTLEHRGTWTAGEGGWHVRNSTLTWATGLILDVDIERTGPHRIWWLDSCSERD